MVKIGDKITISVEAEVMQVSNGHGECYQVLLPQLDFSEPRILWLNPDEVEKIDTDF